MKFVVDSVDEIYDMLAENAEKYVAPMIERMIAKSAHVNANSDPSIQDSLADTDSIVNMVTRTSDGVEIIVEDIGIPQKPILGTTRKPGATGYDAFIPDSETQFAEWVEYGEWMDLAGYFGSGRTDKPKRTARPFIQPVVDELESNPDLIVSKLFHGINNK